MVSGGNDAFTSSARAARAAPVRRVKRTTTLPVWGERVALERVARELSQAELGRLAAERLGRAVSRDTVANVERGRGRVPDDLRVALAEVFDLAPEVLFPYPRLAPAARTGRRSVNDDDLADEHPAAAVA